MLPGPTLICSHQPAASVFFLGISLALFTSSSGCSHLPGDRPSVPENASAAVQIIVPMLRVLVQMHSDHIIHRQAMSPSVSCTMCC